MESGRRKLSLTDLGAILGLVSMVFTIILQAINVGSKIEAKRCLFNNDILYLWLFSLPLIAFSGIIFASLIQFWSENPKNRQQPIILFSSFVAGIIIFLSARYSAGCFSSHIFAGGSDVADPREHALRLVLSVLTFAGFAFMVCRRLEESPPGGATASRRRGGALLMFCGVGVICALGHALNGGGA